MNHVQLSALRYGNGCRIVCLGNGLVMKSHCARACIEGSAKTGEDFRPMATPRSGDERACPGLFLDQLQEITDADRPGGRHAEMDPKTAGAERAKVTHAIEEECGKTAEDASCQVVSMYRGGQYKLYRFKRYKDIRLVFAPEEQIAFFGGDPDNFTYPRFNLDMSFVRAYDNGQPANTAQHHFSWSKAGSREGDLVFVVGNPGSTGRQHDGSAGISAGVSIRAAGSAAPSDHDLPRWPRRSARDDVRNTIFGLENTQKAITGYQSGLLDPKLMDRSGSGRTNSLPR
jgi:hypothetical protein